MTKEQHPNDIAYSNGYKQGVFDTEMKYQTTITTKDQEKEEAIRKGWKGYVVVDPKADKYKYSPVFSTVEGAKIWLRGKGLNGLEIVEVDVLLALPTKDNK